MSDVRVTLPTVSPTCSVIISAYNAADTVAETIRSVLMQTRQDFEVIVVDDGSTDDTALRIEQLTSDPRVRLYRQANSGNAAARNTAIANSSGEYVSTLDSDDLWTPRYLEVMVQALEEAPDAGFSYTDAWALEETTGRFRRATVLSPCSATEVPADPKSFLAFLMSGNFIYGSVTMRRTVLEQVGGFDARLTHVEDYELSLRIAAAGYRGVRVPGPPLAIYRDRAGGLHNDSQACLMGKRYALHKVLDNQRLPPEACTAGRAHLMEIESQLDRLTNRAFPNLVRRRVRRLLADTTRPWRLRRRWLSEPPAYIAAAFPELGYGLRAERPAAPPQAQ